jgi:hypothetical protein
MADTRIYLVEEKRDDVTESFLVRASSQARAIRHVAQLTRFTAKVADPDELVDLASKGVKVQAAGEES